MSLSSSTNQDTFAKLEDQARKKLLRLKQMKASSNRDIPEREKDSLSKHVNLIPEEDYQMSDSDDIDARITTPPTNKRYSADALHSTASTPKLQGRPPLASSMQSSSRANRAGSSKRDKRSPELAKELSAASLMATLKSDALPPSLLDSAKPIDLFVFLLFFNRFLSL